MCSGMVFLLKECNSDLVDRLCNIIDSLHNWKFKLIAAIYGKWYSRPNGLRTMVEDRVFILCVLCSAYRHDLRKKFVVYKLQEAAHWCGSFGHRRIGASAAVIAAVTIRLCKQKHNAEKAKAKLTQKMAGCEETVVTLPLVAFTCVVSEIFSMAVI